MIDVSGYGLRFDDLVIEPFMDGTWIVMGEDVLLLPGIDPAALGPESFVGLASPPNIPPVAEDLSFALSEDGPAQSLDLLSDAENVDGSPLSLLSVAGVAAAPSAGIALPSGAVLSVGSGGSVLYDPNGAFEALSKGASDFDAFTYTISDGQDGGASASVMVEVEGVNDAPVAVDDATALAVADGGVIVGVLGNDRDAEGGLLEITTLDTSGLATTRSRSTISTPRAGSKVARA